MIYKKEIKEYQNLEIPDIIYKYRGWEKPFHKTILTEQELFFAAANTFEDKRDCKNLTRYDLLTPKQIYDKYKAESYTMNPTYSEIQHCAFAEIYSEVSPMNDKYEVFNQMFNEYEKFCNAFGILSLTEHNHLFKMWDKYAMNHTGICVGFDARKLFAHFQGGWGKVDYYKELPTIYPAPEHELLEQAIIRIFSKEDIWEFEQEYRVHKFLNGQNRAIRLNKEDNIIKEIILGANMSEESKTEISEIISKKLPHVIIKNAVIGTNNIVLIK